MSSTIVVPVGKRLFISKGGNQIPSSGDIELVLEEDITISLSSSFGPLVQPPATNFINAIGASIRDWTKGKINISGQWKQLTYQTWQSTDPVAFNATVGFYMGSSGINDAKKEVYDPTIELCNLVLPTEGAGGNLQSPGPSLNEALGAASAGYAIAITIGQLLYIDHAIILKAEPTFSNETDTNGYPIWSKVSLDIKSIFSATVELLNQINVPKSTPTPIPAAASKVTGGK